MARRLDVYLPSSRNDFMKHDTHEEKEVDSKHNKVPAGYSGTVYTCPMHPEVRDVEDSGCPICKMSLKPEESVAEMAQHV